MSRILLLLVLLLWMAGTSDATPRPPANVALDTATFLAFYPLLVLSMGLWGRMVARRVAAFDFGRRLRRFHLAMQLARFAVPAWFGVGVFSLGWGWTVEQQLGLAWVLPARLPGLLVGCLPAVLAWAGLWWSQYPAERALREQSILAHLEDDLPLHRPPTFAEYVQSNVRLQVLFTLVPVMLIVAARDVIALTLFDSSPTAVRGPGGTSSGASNEGIGEFLTFLASAGVVFLFAPEILRRVLRTSPLPDGPLRRRLEAMARRTGMRYRDILVWHTQFNMGNAAVMGIVPRMRYVLLSDLLLERLDDDEIEAVFAHEVGHVVHRHMVWYVVFFLTLIFGTGGPLLLATRWLDAWGIPPHVQQLVALLGGVGAFFLIFGFLSRRFERQADVFAARVIEAYRPAGPSLLDRLLPPAVAPAPAAAGSAAGQPAAGSVYDLPSHVGPYGATIFGSALRRVAVINNIPVAPRARRDGSLMQRVGYVLGSFMDLAHDWLHGSIPSRMIYLQSLSADPALTGRFDRVMTRLYGALVFSLFASAAWTWMAAARGI